MLNKGIFLAEEGNITSHLDCFTIREKEHLNSKAGFYQLHKGSSFAIGNTDIMQINVASNENFINHLPAEKQYCLLVFSLSATLEIGEKDQIFQLYPNELVILFGNEKGSCAVQVNAADECQEFFFLHIDQQTIESFTVSFCEGLKMGLTTEIVQVLKNIANVPSQAEFLKEYVWAKTVELLCLVAQQFVITPKSSESRIPAHLIKVMNEAKEMMLSDLKVPFSIHTIARAVGTNENYLKKYFKLMFGQTIFNFLQSHKMQLAKQMLLEKKLPIGQISADLGYKNPSNFSANFYKYYGYLPKRIKAGKLSLLLFLEDFSLLFEECILALNMV